MDRIVVGVDGSEGSRAAMKWAVDEARLRGAVLEVVHSYAPSPVPEWAGSEEQASQAIHGPRLAAEELLRTTRDNAEGVTVECHAVETSSPAQALIEHARGATMLVVSARGLGSFRSLLMGSVSQQVAHHAECPVVIVRDLNSGH